MKEKLEKIDLKSPPAIIGGIAAAGILGWKLRQKYLYKDDAPGKKDPLPTPLSEMDEDDIVYVIPYKNDEFEIGAWPQGEKPYGIVVTVNGDPVNGSEEYEIDSEVSEKDPVRLEKLSLLVGRLFERWKSITSDQ